MAYIFMNDSTQTTAPLLQACTDGDLNHARCLLESGCDPNVRDSRGRTAIHLASARGCVGLCRLLHKFGADLQATDNQGNTALHLCGHVDIIRFLVSSGLKADICNHNGATPLVLAKRRGVNRNSLSLLEYLEERELKGFNCAGALKMDPAGLPENDSLMESHTLLYTSQHSGKGLFFSFHTTWHDFVEDLGFWRVLMLMLVIALLSLGIAYYVSGAMPFTANQPELVEKRG
ncbi:ankyrin repeat domain-containing protein 46-like [Brienomyrus brachyistius]|uniref:ankyrin repeat domain-containing protein 46-like n=1 Tax=Brienomyrus brachyistius TaxID=42636 RepID=UPI0020B278BB|nr:ankyrin repeat domain-containing protein 46-like [Brienomyrus brachyistius]